MDAFADIASFFETSSTPSQESSLPVDYEANGTGSGGGWCIIA